MPRTAKKPTAPSSVGGSGQSAAPVTPARVQPITVPTGQPYGEAKALADAQRQLPLPDAGGPAPVPVPGGGGPPNFAAALAAAQADTAPAVGFGGETSRPHEPVTAGLPTGPGPGPEALSTPASPSPSANIAAVLEAAAQASGSSDLVFLAKRARDLGQ